MTFNVAQSIEILERTPIVLQYLLHDISPEWTSNNEGGDTWSVYDIIGHLIHGEKTDWIPRAVMILSDETDKTFESFDRFAQFEASKGETLTQLLAEFKDLRTTNVAQLHQMSLTDQQLAKKGTHPALGEVTLAQLLATWVVHDLNHLSQISRVMAKQYQTEVGPWMDYLGILHR